MSKDKEAAARFALENYLGKSKYVGIGSGTTIIPLIKMLGEMKSDAVFVPTSFQSSILLRENNLIVSNLEETPKLDVVFDGADEITFDLNVIKGGGGCLVQEKIVASCTNNFIIVASEHKVSSKLGDKWKRGLPIEVIPMAWSVVKTKIEAKFGGSADLRMGINKMGPIVTDNSNFIIDWKFDGSKIHDFSILNSELNCIPGIVETGIFVDFAIAAVIGREDGTAYEIKK